MSNSCTSVVLNSKNTRRQREEEGKEKKKARRRRRQGKKSGNRNKRAQHKYKTPFKGATNSSGFPTQSPPQGSFFLKQWANYNNNYYYFQFLNFFRHQQVYSKENFCKPRHLSAAITA